MINDIHILEKRTIRAKLLQSRMVLGNLFELTTTKLLWQNGSETASGHKHNH